jgi:hypothetical protein
VLIYTQPGWKTKRLMVVGALARKCLSLSVA